MPEGQEHIYYLSGENADTLRHAPQIEGFKKQGYDVLFMTDTIDEFWLQNVPDYKGKAFKSVTQGDIDLPSIEKNDSKADDLSKKSIDTLARLKEILHSEVSDVRPSTRLTDLPVCLVAADNAPDMHMEKVLKIQQNYEGDHKPVLEMNMDHALVKALTPETDGLDEIAQLLLDQAKIIEGRPLANPARFAQKMADLMVKSL